ncbi:D-alanine--poly(phosphoribitol) ligase subunit DltA [Eubacterium multiforme]|uniref:D-alanine--D-alanyl carrier protein ligase n=1 Tax=Eubacterium multiforme TaxID=83339 RepID=A0ABT9UTA2_9FIRM|nr:D-alanine--poly(phosphoribitol) ligase subunit DltA [Eubacterium multiforme]MDQ0149514.1 D-alanine--poly(phosphoribitol) ligase subunit 1 [Eubacterium multiforme]
MKIIEGIKKYANTDRIALKCDGEELSYKDLDRFSESIGSYLKEIHNDNTPILIYGNKDNLIVPCMIGALKSGRAYIPLDVTFPVERVLTVSEEVEPKIIFNFTDSAKEEFGTKVKVIDKEDIKKIIEDYKNEVIDKSSWVKEDENAYMLFTSGSTGKPKGVQISSNNLDNFNKWIIDYLKINDSGMTILNQVSYSFDVSVIALYGGLINGATLFSLSKQTMGNYKELFKQLEESNIELWISTPSFVGICLNEVGFNSNMLPKLDSMIVLGEVLSKNLTKEILERFPNLRMMNGYGPTEATVAVTAIDVTDEILNDEKSIPIGYAMDGIEIKIVDKEGKEVADGEKGELIIVGKSVSKGYFKNEEKTNEVFYFEDNNGVKERAYRAGDIAYKIDGKIYYCGRKDFQIKLNGFRIEIEDIENNLCKVPNVRNAVVIPVYKDEKIVYLQGVVELKEKNNLSNLKNGIIIKKELEKLIQTYMVPRSIKIVEEFPINTNGKIDRKKLMEEM